MNKILQPAEKNGQETNQNTMEQKPLYALLPTLFFNVPLYAHIEVLIAFFVVNFLFFVA